MLTEPQLLRAHEKRLASLEPYMRDAWARVHVRQAARGRVAIIAWRGGRRTLAQQQDRFEQGREYLRGVWHVVSAADVVTNAQGLDGPHPHGMAFDCAWIIDGVYTPTPPAGWIEDYAADCREEGLVSGLSWGDGPHAERKGWRDLVEG